MITDSEKQKLRRKVRKAKIDRAKKRGRFKSEINPSSGPLTQAKGNDKEQVKE
jgi:hypothetical protein